MTNIALVGLGNMGGPMAANLVKAGHRVSGYDLTPSSREAAAAAAEVLITMLPAGQHVVAVLQGARKP